MTSIRFSDLSLLAAAALGLAACGGPAGGSAPKPPVAAPVEVVTAATLPDPVVTTGTVRSAIVSPLAAKVIGNITRVHVSEGDRVRAGELLVEIDDREGVARSAGASAAASEAEEAIAAAGAAVKAAEANARLAEATWERFAALRERGSVSAQEFEEVTARKAAAAAQLEQARQTRQALAARREAARAGRAEAETFLSHFRVRSPIDGLVTARMVDPGMQAAPGMTLLVVEDDSRSRVETTVEEATAARIRAGDRVAVIDGSRSIGAHVTTVVPAVDPATRSALVKIDLPPDAGLRSGSLVRVVFTAGTRSGVTVPQTAVRRRGHLTSVFVVAADGRARMRLITLGRTHGDRVEVLSGLDAGETVVARAGSVREGDPVRGERA